MSSVPVGQENVCAPADPARTRQMQATANKTTNLYTATSSMNPVKGLSLVRKTSLSPGHAALTGGNGKACCRYINSETQFRGAAEKFFAGLFVSGRFGFGHQILGLGRPYGPVRSAA